MLAELEKRHIAAPRVARDHGAARIGETAFDEVAKPRIHVLELWSADVPDQGVAPFAAVSNRPAVIDERDREPGVDVGLNLRLPPVHVEPGWAPVAEPDHRELAA